MDNSKVASNDQHAENIDAIKISSEMIKVLLMHWDSLPYQVQRDLRHLLNQAFDWKK